MVWNASRCFFSNNILMLLILFLAYSTSFCWCRLRTEQDSDKRIFTCGFLPQEKLKGYYYFVFYVMPRKCHMLRGHSMAISTNFLRNFYFTPLKIYKNWNLTLLELSYDISFEKQILLQINHRFESFILYAHVIFFWTLVTDRSRNILP